MTDTSLLATQVGNPIIRRVLASVENGKLGSQLVCDCIGTMRRVNDQMSGVGTSANQVGYDLRISLMHVNQQSFVLGRKISARY